MHCHHTPKLYFLHIPKAAGTSFRTWLLDLFDLGDFLPIDHLSELEACGPSAIANHRLFSGHFGWRLMELAEQLGEHVVPITMLRQPVALYGSGWSYAPRISEDDLAKLQPEAREQAQSIQKLVIEKNLERVAYSAFSNIMVRYLAHNGTEVDVPAVLTENSLERAKKRLAEMPFFGLVEDWERTAVLFADAFRLPLRLMNRQENRTDDRDGDRDNSEFIKAVKAANSLDVQLYEFGRELFDSRFHQVAKKFGLPHDAKPEEFTEALTHQFMQRHASFSICKSLERLTLPISSGIATQGFTYRYPGADKQHYCIWSGPQTKSSIFLPLERSSPLTVHFDFEVIMSLEIRSGLEVFVDGSKAEFSLAYAQDKAGNYFNKISIKVPALSTAKSGYTEISFKVPSTLFNADPAFNCGLSFAIGGDIVVERRLESSIISVEPQRAA